MEVCHLLNDLPHGGAPNLLLDIVSNTDDPDISYTVCYIEGRGDLVEAFEEAGAEVVHFDADFKFDPRALWRFARFFRDAEFDVLHTHLPYSQTLGRVLGRLGDVDCFVSTQHNVPANYHPITRLLERLTRPLDDATVAVSEGVELAFRGRSYRYDGSLEGKWCTIYNGIDVEGFNAAVQRDREDRASLPRTSNGRVFLNVARYVPAKSQATLIDAMASVVEELPGSQLYLVGWGSLEDRLRDRTNALELSEHVTITGRVPTVHRYFASADVFVSSSTFEGLPISHLEAMAAALPVVSTAIPGVEEVVVDGETGLLVPPGDPDALADAMVSLATHSDRETIGERGFQRALDRYSVGTTVDQYARLYRSLESAG